MNVPTCAMSVVSLFRAGFSALTYHRVLILVLAAILTTGRRTMTNVLHTVQYQAPGHISSYHRVLSQRRWSTWALARPLMTCLLDSVLPPGPVLLAGDDTVTEHLGPHVFGNGRHRDGVRSTHSDTAYRWGHKWVVVSVLVTCRSPPDLGPCQSWRPWSRPPEWDCVHGTRHQTPAHISRLLLARLIRWFPERQFIFVGDTGYGTSATARFCHHHRQRLTLVSKFYPDATLYELPPPRTRRTIGRPRVKGQKLASPQQVVATTATRTSLMVAWYGGTTRTIEVVTDTGHWYRIGVALVAVRWVYVHDGTGTHRDEYLFTTDLSLCPKQIIECYTQRWSIETTFQECREHLMRESTKCYGKQTVLRFTPCIFGLYTLIVLPYLQLPEPLRSPVIISWRGKSTTTFADMITCVRRAIWQQWLFHTPTQTASFSILPKSLQETILYALAPAT